MKIDCHVHVCATSPGRGVTSRLLRRRFSFAYIRWRLGLPFFADDERLEREVEDRLARSVNEAEEIDAAVVLAFDWAYTNEGRRDEANTHLAVTNEYAAELAQKHPKLLMGASVHPYRSDALAELEKCVAAGAVLLKWLPVVQNIDPVDPRCMPFYEALAHHRLPLLCHTGGELSLPYYGDAAKYADPALLVPALERGVTVIAAHCGTRSRPRETDYLPTFLRMARENENLYGDTAALNVPTRSYAFKKLLADDTARQRLVHGSDWPIAVIPPAQLGVTKSVKLIAAERNWLRRDVLVKQALGFDDDYWNRAAKILRLPREQSQLAGGA
jgi:predicted TIM-barrel fold metal-dependent hydrolase